MSWICSVVFLGIAILGKLYNGRWINLLTAFAGFYGVTIFFASFRLFGMIDGTVLECMVLLVGILAFAMGYFFSKKIRVQKDVNQCLSVSSSRDSSDQGIPSGYVLRNWVLFFVVLFVAAYTLYRVYITIELLGSGYRYVQIRTIYFNADEIFEGALANRYGKSVLGIYVHLPLLYSVMILASMALFKDIGIKHRKLFIITVYVMIVCYAFSNGGREIIFNTMAMIFVCYFLFSEKSGRRIFSMVISLSKKKIIIAMVCVAAVFFMYRLSVGRLQTGQGSLKKILETVYMYFCGYFPHLGIRLEEASWENFTYGNNFLLGLIKPFAAVIRGIFGVTFSDAYVRADTLTSMLQSRVNIGGDMMMNAYVSPFYYFYMDFGFLSLVFESFLYGLFCGYTEKMFHQKPDQRNTFIYLFAFLGVISSMIRWVFGHPRMAMIVYFIPILFVNARKLKRSSNTYL